MKKLLIFAAATAIAGTVIGQKVQDASQKLRYAEAAISQLYVDSVNEEKLVEEAIKGMLQSLDPHSAYSTPQETKELNEPLEGNFSGIGITYNLISDTVYVIQTLSGGPSDKVGMLPGDRIIAVNDSSIAGQKYKTSDISKRLRGPKGSEVVLTTLRSSGAGHDTIKFHVTRADIPIYSVDAAYMVSPQTGYISINKFAAETANEFRQALGKLQKKGMKNLILDLTDNTGGYLGSAVELLSELLPDGTLTVYTEGLNSPRRDFMSKAADKKGPMFEDGRLVVMTNQYTASAAEITSGAVQDWDRGVIVGRRTYGKGLVQRPIPFPDGSMIRLTTAHYYTPTGRDIQKPYTKGDSKSYHEDISVRFNHGELMHEDSIVYDEKLRTATLKLNRPVYGGGGISPDKFVPLDTMAVSKYYRELTAKSLINKYSVSYVDAHRKELKKQYKTDDSFVAGFHVTDAMLKDLVAMGEREGVKYDEEGYHRSEELLKMVIKGLIGRDVYENQTYDKVYNGYDPIFREALRIIEGDDYNSLLNNR